MNDLLQKPIRLAMLVLVLSVPAAFAQQTTPAPTHSATSSPVSGTPAIKKVLAACAAAAEELAASRELIAALEDERKALAERLATEQKATALLTEINSSRKAEADALRSAITARDDAIHSRDAVIASQEKLIAELKKHRSSVWRRIGDVLAGAAIFAIVK